MPEIRHRIMLGFDFGMKRIGVAVGQLVTQSANPLVILKARDGVPLWDEITQLIKQWNADGLVVGIPYNMDGTEQKLTYAAKRFAEKLKQLTHLPIYLMDERLTTVEARQQMFDSGLPLEEIDSYAAKLILESWLSQRKGFNHATEN